jgi:hypothetical protein
LRELERDKAIEEKARSKVMIELWKDPKFVRLSEKQDRALHEWNVLDAYKHDRFANPEELRLADQRAKYAMKQVNDYQTAAFIKAGFRW